MPWDDDLWEEQRIASGYARGNRVLLAGPGTGKTFVLVRRIEYLISEHDIDPHRITALTFTRAAAAEMRDRLQARLGERGARVKVSTLHSYALRELLKAGGEEFPQPLRVVGDWEERWVVVEELARLLDRRVREISNERGTGALDRLADDWDTLAIDDHGWEEGFADPQFLSAWRAHREVYGYTLRSELVYQLLVELRASPAFRPRAQTDVYVVDEYQDLNRCDLNAIAMLADRTGAELFVAGEDDQSIYSFRHAHPSGIRNFVNEFADAERITMSECHRCGEDVVDISSWLIEQEIGREPKDLVSRTPWESEVHLLRFSNQQEEAQHTARLLHHYIDAGLEPHEALVLVRSDPQGRLQHAIDEQLAARGHRAYLPRVAGSVGDEIQVLLEYLLLSDDLAENNHIDDLAVRSLLELEDNGIGDARLRAVLDRCLGARTRYVAGIDHLRRNPSEFGSTGIEGVAQAVQEIIDKARGFAQRDDEAFEDWVDRVCAAVGIEAEARRVIDAAAEQVSAQVEEGAQKEEARINFTQEFIASMTKLGDTLPAQLPDHVTITTMHGAKGLSAHVVVVLQAEDELFPGQDTDEAEANELRRLLYVSLTRARKRLFVAACEHRTGPQAFAGGHQAPDRHLTRFLQDYGLTAEPVPAFLASDPAPIP